MYEETIFAVEPSGTKAYAVGSIVLTSRSSRLLLPEAKV
jgi:hypothetical protein